MNKQKLKNLVLNNQELDKCYDFMYRSANRKAITGIIIAFIVLFSTFFVASKIQNLIIISVTSFSLLLGFYLIFAIAILIIVNVYQFTNIRICYNLYCLVDLFCFAFTSIAWFYFVMMFILTPTTIEGISMESTFYNDDKIFVWHLFYTPKTNDVVIIDINKEHYNIQDERYFIKRIVALGGDKVEYQNGYLVVNNQEVEAITANQFISLTSTSLGVSKLTNNYLEEGYLIVMGDNRQNSVDSRNIGLIYLEDVVGKAVIRIFPLGRFGFIK